MSFPSRFLPFPKILDICLLAALPASVSAQTVTVFSARAAFEAAMGNFKITDDFSLNGTFLNVISVNGAAGGQQYADIARDSEAATVWETPFGSTAFGGTWDNSVGGPGSGLAFELDFGGGNIVAVPGAVPGNAPFNTFFGFTASQPFLKVRVRPFDSVGGTLQERYSLSNLTVQVPAAFTDARFAQSGTGGWDTAGNWDIAAVPSLNQRTFISPAGGSVVSGPAAEAAVRQLIVGNGTVVSRLNLNAGGPLVAAGGGLVQANGILGGAGRFLGSLGMAAGSTLTVSDGQTLQVGAPAAAGFNTLGTITVGTGHLLLEDTGGTPLGTLTTLAGGTLTTLGGTAQIGSGDTLRGNGALTGAYELLSGGTLRAESGTLQVAQFAASQGTAVVDAGSTLSLGGTGAAGFSSVTVGAGSTLAYTGRLQFLASSTLGAAATVSGQLGLDFAGPVSHPGGQIFSAGSGALTILNTSFTCDAADTFSASQLVLEGTAATFLFQTEAVISQLGNQIVLKGGRLFPQASVILPPACSVEVTAQNGSVIATAGRTLTMEGVISGAGRLAVTGNNDGTVRLTGQNLHAGGTDIAGVTLEVASDSQLGGPAGALLIGRENGLTDIRGKLRALGDLNIAATRTTTFRLATVDTNGFDVTFNQPVSGQDLTKQGSGVLRFNTVNTFNSGVHNVDVEGGAVRLGINEALGQPRVALMEGDLDLNGFSQTVRRLNGPGRVLLGAGGALTLVGGSTLEAVFSGTGSLNFGQAGISPDSYRVLGENTFSGPVTITQGNRITLKTTAALGAAGNPVLLDNGGIESDSAAPGPVLLDAAYPMTIGPGGAFFGANGQSLVIGTLLAGNVPIGVHGGGEGFEVRFAHPANTFTGSLSVGSNTFGDAVLGIVADGSLGQAANVITLGYNFFDGESTRTGSGTLRAFADISFPASRTLRLDGEDDDGGGVFDTNGFNLTVAAPLTELHAGTPLTKTGLGTLTLQGTNSYTGLTLVNGGTLAVNGSLPGSTEVNNGILSGTGTVGTVDVQSGGTLAPGNGAGTLRAGDVTFGSNTTFALHFASPTSASQLAVTGKLTLNDDVGLVLSRGYTPAAADPFIVIANDGTGPPATLGSTTFFTIGGNQLTEGESFSAAGANWTISYVGGTGNDVTLTMTPAAVAISLELLNFNFSAPAGGGTGQRLQGSVSGPPGAAVRLLRSPDLVEWTLLSTITLNGSGSAAFDLVDPLAAQRAFYKWVIP
ncbi:MAG: autotransporter-associated beta strand repeat-containing protein [Verrucomicrobiota bacterium]